MAEIVLGPESDPAPAALVGGPTVVPLEMVPFPMLVADGTGQVLAVNRRWTELSGLSPEDSLGSGWRDALEPVAPLEDLVLRVAAGEVGHGDACEWAAVGGRRTQWWVASDERAGARLVGLAVGTVEALSDEEKLDATAEETLGASGNVVLGASGNVVLGASGNVALGASGNVALGASGNVALGASGNVVLGAGREVALEGEILAGDLFAPEGESSAESLRPLAGESFVGDLLAPEAGAVATSVIGLEKEFFAGRVDAIEERGFANAEETGVVALDEEAVAGSEESGIRAAAERGFEPAGEGGAAPARERFLPEDGFHPVAARSFEPAEAAAVRDEADGSRVGGPEPIGPAEPVPDDPVLRELPALIRSFDALLVTLDRVLEHWVADPAPAAI